MPARHAPPDRSHPGEKPKAAKLVLTLDGIRINELTTADIRSWQRLIVQEVGQYSVKKPPLGWSMYQLVASNKAAPPMKVMGVKIHECVIELLLRTVRYRTICVPRKAPIAPATPRSPMEPRCNRHHVDDFLQLLLGCADVKRVASVDLHVGGLPRRRERRDCGKLARAIVEPLARRHVAQRILPRSLGRCGPACHAASPLLRRRQNQEDRRHQERGEFAHQQVDRARRNLTPI
jgi:hypothetical protein